MAVGRAPSLASAVLVLAVAACSGSGQAIAPTSPGLPSPSDRESETPRSFDNEVGSPEVLDLSPWPRREFWLQVAPGGFNIAAYDSLASMTEDAHVVVVGRAAHIRESRPIPPEANAEGMSLGLIEFAVEEVVGGKAVEASPGVIYVEFLLTDERLMPRFIGRVPNERVLLFLHNKGADAEKEGRDPNGPLAGFEYYILSNSASFFVDHEGLVESSLLAEHAWIDALNGTSFDALIRSVRSSAGKP